MKKAVLTLGILSTEMQIRWDAASVIIRVQQIHVVVFSCASYLLVMYGTVKGKNWSQSDWKVRSAL